MPQGVVRNDGSLTQAHALKSCFELLPQAGLFLVYSDGGYSRLY